MRREAHSTTRRPRIATGRVPSGRVPSSGIRPDLDIGCTSHCGTHSSWERHMSRSGLGLLMAVQTGAEFAVDLRQRFVRLSHCRQQPDVARVMTGGDPLTAALPAPHAPLSVYWVDQLSHLLPTRIHYSRCTVSSGLCRSGADCHSFAHTVSTASTHPVLFDSEHGIPFLRSRLECLHLLQKLWIGML